MTYRQDRTWANKYLPQVIKILRENINHLVEIKVAPDRKDMTQAVDLVIRLQGGNVAVRLRRSNCKYRDLTIRAKRDSGTKTELAKIKQGFGKWYFYGWINERDKVYEWMLIDLDKMRSSELLEKKRLIPNDDGTYFIAISKQELKSVGCLILEKRL